MTNSFTKDVISGLTSSPKKLSSKYFYDSVGDDLFVQIMNLPEYYLTRSEMEIFTDQTEEMIDLIGVMPNQAFELIELGAGDGTKTIHLLSALLQNNYHFTYVPIDISTNALEQLSTSLSEQLPKLEVEAKQGDYFKVLGDLNKGNKPKVILFLGSNIGNMHDKQASEFLYQLGSNLKAEDKLILGVDRIKPADIVLPAYNDSQGVTRAFNLNILQRINDNIGANFNINNFEHAPTYSKNSGIAESYLVSLVDQEVYFDKLNKTITFAKGEMIHTEISRKYNEAILGKLIEQTDFEIIGKLRDTQEYFSDYILERK